MHLQTDRTMTEWNRLRDTTGASILLSVARRLKLPEEDCLLSTQINEECLDTPLASISVWQELTLIRNIQNIRGSDEELGLLVSEHCTAATMGMFGQALATSETLQQAWKLMEQYELLGLAFSRFEFQSDLTSLRMTLHDFEMPTDCQRFCEERGLGGCLILFSDLLGTRLTPKAVCMRLPKPNNPNVYHRFFGTTVSFDQSKTEIVFDRELGSHCLPNANRKLHLASIRHCNEVLRAHTLPSSYEDRVVRYLERNNIDANLDDVATEFEMSGRQLRRYLTEEDRSFRNIQLNLKMGRAKAMLESGISVNQVALDLGYHSQASFSRAFKKHNGLSPKHLLPK